MSVREDTQMSLNTESAARRTRMEGQCRTSQKYLLLHVWCGLLTMSLVVMAALVASIKSQSEQPSDSRENSSHPTASTFFSPEKLVGISSSYIELRRLWNGDDGWQKYDGCESCSLCVHQNSIYINSSSPESSVFFIYAQVVFRKNQVPPLFVRLIKKGSNVTKDKIVAYAPAAVGGSVWMGRIFRLTGGDSVRLNITGDYWKDETFWGAFQLH